MKKKILGLDLGIASVGWSVVGADDNLKPTHIIDTGAYVFDTLEDGQSGKLENENRRIKRGARRLNRRKKLRLQDLRKLLDEKLGVDFYSLDLRKYNNPFEIKIKGLKEELSKEELSVALYHYVKYRGFKSSRKSKNDADAKEEGKVLKEIEGLRKELVCGKTVTEVIYDKYLNKPKEERRIHNTKDSYIFSVSRDMYLDEINILLDKQISFGVCDEDFKQKYIAIFTRQRDFSDGPGYPSKYGSNGTDSFLQKNIGKCKFDNELRAPKSAYSAEAFVLLSFLNNFKYKSDLDEHYYSELDANEIETIFKNAKKQPTINVANISKWIGKKIVKVKGHEISKKQQLSYLNKYKKKYNIDGNLKPEDYESFDKFVSQEFSKEKFNVGFSNYISMKNQFLKYGVSNPDKKAFIEDFISNDINFDIIAELLLVTKTYDGIENKVLQYKWPIFVADILSGMDDVTETINLSISICQQLIPHLLAKNTYDKAMEHIGYNHTGDVIVEKREKLPEIDEALKELDIYLTNSTVRHTLVCMRRVVNELIGIYGSFDCINIECTRELKSSFEVRNKIKNEQDENRYENLQTKLAILEKYSDKFRSINHIKKNDVIKYKLFKEQKGIDPYSGETISEYNMFDDNQYQIDHIIPYSRSYDDSFDNKVLVSSVNNQNKQNRIPFEWLGSKGMIHVYDFISKVFISRKKRENLQLKQYDESERGFDNGDISDTSYIAKVAKKLITSYLQPSVCLFPSGSITNLLKEKWGLKGLTHSYQSDNLRSKNSFTYSRVEVEEEKIVLCVINEVTRIEEEIELKYKKPSEKKELPQRVQRINRAIKYFYTNNSLTEIMNDISMGRTLNVNHFINYVNSYSTSINKQEEKENLLTIAFELKDYTEKSNIKKNRDNHLHHALDAIIIACTNRSIIQKVNTYNALGNISYEDYLSSVPQPYEDFIYDAMYRVYERDYQKMKDELLNLKCYQNEDNKHDLLEYLKVLYPVRKPNKYKAGAFFEETTFGYRKIELQKPDGTIEEKEFIVKKIPVANLTYDSKTNTLKQTIFGADENLKSYEANNKKIKDACLTWFKEGKPTDYPVHPDTDNPIKKVTIVETNNINALNKIKESEKGFAKNTSVVRIDVYNKKGDLSKQPILYLVPVYYYQIATEEINSKYHKNKKINYQLMSNAREEDIQILCNEDIKRDYVKIGSMPRNSLIEISFKDGRRCVCYSGGCTRGTIEIYSILGDNFDLVYGNNNFSDHFTSEGRNRPLITGIESIKIRNISITGKLS